MVTLLVGVPSRLAPSPRVRKISEGPLLYISGRSSEIQKKTVCQRLQRYITSKHPSRHTNHER